MKAETLKEIKLKLRDLHHVVSNLADYWKEFEHYEMIGVLIQNASFDGSDTANYSHEQAEKELETILNLLRILKNYHNNYFEKYAYNEMYMIVTGIQMSEDIEDLKNETDLNSFESQTYE